MCAKNKALWGISDGGMPKKWQIDGVQGADAAFKKTQEGWVKVGASGFDSKRETLGKIFKIFTT